MFVRAKCCMIVILFAFLVLQYAETVLAIPSLSDLRHVLLKTQQELNAAKADVAKKTAQLGQAQVAVANAKKDLDAAGTIVSKDQTILADRLSAMTKAHNDLAAESNLIAQLTTKTKQGEHNADAALQKLLNTPITFFDMSWAITVEYDLKSRGFNAWADMPNGMKLTSTQISSLFQGQVAFPDFNPLELVDDSFGVSIQTNCNFDDVAKKFYQDQGPNDRVYVSTRGLSELFSAEQLISSGADAVFSGGSSIEGTTEEIAKGCLRELNAVYAFLQDAAKDEAKDLMPKIVDAIFKQKEFTSPSTKIQIKMLKAKMTYTVALSGTSDLTRYFPDLAPKNADVKTKPLDSPRFGFAVIVKDVGPRPSINDLRATFGAAKPFGPGFLKKLGLPADVLQFALSDQTDISSLMAAEMRKQFQALDYSQIKPDPANPIFLDLKNTTVGTTLTTTLNKYLKAVYSAVSLRMLSINTETGQVVVIADVKTTYSNTLQNGMNLVGEKAQNLAADLSKEWRAAGAAAAKLEQQLAAENAKLPGLNQAVKLATDQYNSALSDLNGAKNEQKARQQVYDSAVAAENQANSALIVANNQVTTLTNQINQINRWIHQLEHPKL